MVNQTNNKIACDINKLSENETLAVIEYISQLLFTRHVPIQGEIHFNDELIASLSEKRGPIHFRQARRIR